MPDTPTAAPRPHPVSQFLVEEIAAVLYQDDRDQGQISEASAIPVEGHEDVVESYYLTARTVLEALRDRHLPGPDETDTVLTEDQVSRILWHYDPAGSAYADVARLAHSHEAIRAAAQALNTATETSTHAAGQYLGEMVWLVGHLADNHGAPALLLPARLASHVSGARAIYDPARYTVAIPLDQTAPRR